MQYESILMCIYFNVSSSAQNNFSHYNPFRCRKKTGCDRYIVIPYTLKNMSQYTQSMFLNYLKIFVIFEAVDIFGGRWLYLVLLYLLYGKYFRIKIILPADILAVYHLRYCENMIFNMVMRQA